MTFILFTFSREKENKYSFSLVGKNWAKSSLAETTYCQLNGLLHTGITPSGGIPPLVNGNIFLSRAEEFSAQRIIARWPHAEWPVRLSSLWWS